LLNDRILPAQRENVEAKVAGPFLGQFPPDDAARPKDCDSHQ
jgi:hypothetical protein